MSAVSAVLDDVDRLLATGDSSGALDRLDAANRERPSAQLERRLLTLRHERFEDFRPTVAPACAPIVAEPAETPSLLPEMNPEHLDVAALREGLASHGCVRIPGLIGSGAAAELRRGIDAAFEAFDHRKDSRDDDAKRWFSPFTPSSGDYRIGGRTWMRESGGLWAVDSPRMFVQVLELARTTGVRRLIEDYFGERPAMSANKCNLRRVPVTSATNWHQDGAFLGEGVRSMNLWLGLSDCGVDAPGLDLVPRRFDGVVETGGGDAFFDWSVSSDTVAEVAGEAGVIRPEFRAGDALLFDHLSLHRTAVSAEMTKERYAIESWFFAPSHYPEGQIPLIF